MYESVYVYQVVGEVKQKMKGLQTGLSSRKSTIEQNNKMF